MVKIRRTPRHTGDSYIADLVDFEGPASVNLEYDECNLTAENDYIVGEENLKFGVRVEFVAEERTRADGVPIEDCKDTWAHGTIESTIRLKAYRIIHTMWDMPSRSTRLTKSVIPFNRIRRRK